MQEKTPVFVTKPVGPFLFIPFRVAERVEKDKGQQLDGWRWPLPLLLCPVLQTIHILTARREVSVPIAIDSFGRARRGL
jgi:hypothetical protein